MNKEKIRIKYKVEWQEEYQKYEIMISLYLPCEGKSCDPGGDFLARRFRNQNVKIFNGGLTHYWGDYVKENGERFHKACKYLTVEKEEDIMKEIKKEVRRIKKILIEVKKNNIEKAKVNKEGEIYIKV